MSTAAPDTGCCPRFDPSPWQGRTGTWENKPFVHDRAHSFLHIPLDFGRVMARNSKAIEANGSFDADHLVLCDEESAWGTNAFIAVSKPFEGLAMTTITGTFFASVHEGPYRETGAFRKEAITQAVASGLTGIDRVYFWYTTCPKCAKTYGENYTVIFVGGAPEPPSPGVLGVCRQIGEIVKWTCRIHRSAGAETG